LVENATQLSEFPPRGFDGAIFNPEVTRAPKVAYSKALREGSRQICHKIGRSRLSGTDFARSSHDVGNHRAARSWLKCWQFVAGRGMITDREWDVREIFATNFFDLVP
jgi:hypothetical protein